MSATTRVVAVHPERTADPRTVRWHVAHPAGGPTGSGRLGSALSALLTDGVLVAADVHDVTGAVLTTLAAGRSWADDGPAVRRAVQDAALTVDPDPDPDADLRARATHVLRTVVTPYAAGHGGGVELVDVHDGVVDVRMVGACHGCPAAGWTVRSRLLALLRDGTSDVTVRIVGRSGR